MNLTHVAARKVEIAVGVALAALTAVLIRECMLLGAGWSTAGPAPGFFPLLAALAMGAGSVTVVARALGSSAHHPFFETPDEAIALAKVGVPIALAMLSLGVLGFYLMTALYMGFFSAWYGRHRWYVVLAASILVPVALFFTFEQGFKIALPKSAGYGTLIPF